LVIDGQQRMSALAGLPPERNFAVVVVGFVAASEEMQRDQFVLVNRSKPLPRDLLNELLPQVEASLPPGLERKQSAATVLARLRFDQESIFKGRIRGIGTDGAGAAISQSALLTIIESSLRSGLLSRLAVRDGVLDAEVAARVLNVYFSGVARTWPEAWAASSWSSRLVHGVGIYGMGRLMEQVVPTVNWESSRAVFVVSRRLERLKPFCAWTDGTWPVLNCRWNDLQNTSQDKRRLASYLIETFEALHG
jgi:DGQHR domain-containing protein